jgi:hypothetical protein
MGIPLGILTSEWDRRYPLDGDHGVTYERKDGSAYYRQR